MGNDDEMGNGEVDRHPLILLVNRLCCAVRPGCLCKPIRKKRTSQNPVQAAAYKCHIWLI